MNSYINSLMIKRAIFISLTKTKFSGCKRVEKNKFYKLYLDQGNP